VTVTFAGPALRVWILALALGSFAAGIVVGIVIPEMFAAERGPETAQDSAKFLTDKYGLSAEQHRLLVLVHEEYERIDFQILKNLKPSQLDPAAQAERLQNSRKADQRVRFVLDETQRALYDRDETILKPRASGSAGKQENR
jgi:hypothetical protein